MLVLHPKDFGKFIKNANEDTAEVDAWFLVEGVHRIVKCFFD